MCGMKRARGGHDIILADERSHGVSAAGADVVEILDQRQLAHLRRGHVRGQLVADIRHTRAAVLYKNKGAPPAMTSSCSPLK